MGGAPKPGPMQAASGSRGARIYSNDNLDDHIAWVGKKNEAVQTRLPANRDDTGIFINRASFNLRDQLREDDTSTPLQFRYAAADCRLYFTLDNVYNMMALWHDVARAAFEDSSLCVQGSTEYASQGGTALAPPEPSGSLVPATVSATTFTVDYDPSNSDGLPAGDLTNKKISWMPCPNTKQCSPTVPCRSIEYKCSDGWIYEESGCAPPCLADDPPSECSRPLRTQVPVEGWQVADLTTQRSPSRIKGRQRGRPFLSIKRKSSTTTPPTARLNLPSKRYRRPKMDDPLLCSIASWVNNPSRERKSTRYWSQFPPLGGPLTLH